MFLRGPSCGDVFSVSGVPACAIPILLAWACLRERACGSVLAGANVRCGFVGGSAPGMVMV